MNLRILLVFVLCVVVLRSLAQVDNHDYRLRVVAHLDSLGSEDGAGRRTLYFEVLRAYYPYVSPLSLTEGASNDGSKSFQCLQKSVKCRGGIAPGTRVKRCHLGRVVLLLVVVDPNTDVIHIESIIPIKSFDPKGMHGLPAYCPR